MNPWKYNLKCPQIVDNDNTQTSRPFQLMLIFSLRFAQKAALVCTLNVSAISTLQIVYSANLDHHLYRTCYPLQMHYFWKIEYWEAENVYIHTWIAYLLLHNFHLCHCHQVVQTVFRTEVVFRAEVLPVHVEMCRFLCSSSLSADCLLCHCGMEGSCLYDL